MINIKKDLVEFEEKYSMSSEEFYEKISNGELDDIKDYIIWSGIYEGYIDHIEKLKEFEKRNTAVVAVSTDTEQSHWGWLQLPKNQGGIQGVTYPLVADTNKTISKNYDVLAGDYYYDDNDQLQADGELIAYRGLFLIDKEGVVRHQIVNDLPLGRNVDEALRMVDALQFNEENGEACPANWNANREGLKATHEGVAEYFNAN